MVLMLFGAGAAHGAEKIRYEKIPSRIAPFGATVKGLGIKVTTLDGAAHRGQSLRLEAAQVELGRGDCSEDAIRRCITDTIPSEQVVRIEIRRGRRAFDVTIDGLLGAAISVYGCLFGNGLDLCVVGPGLLALSAGIAPVTLAVDGVELLVPPKVYFIVH